uniref:Uncharacterized protein n=1 Tax=Anguilla anguilla TaxID=7936 RepID=A0A0E9VG56_ANGAN
MKEEKTRVQKRTEWRRIKYNDCA